MFASSLGHVSPVNSREIFCVAKFDKKEVTFEMMIRNDQHGEGRKNKRHLKSYRTCVSQVMFME